MLYLLQHIKNLSSNSTSNLTYRYLSSMNLLKLLLVIIFSPSHHILPLSKEDDTKKAGATTIQKTCGKEQLLTHPPVLCPSKRPIRAIHRTIIQCHQSILSPPIYTSTHRRNGPLFVHQNITDMPIFNQLSMLVPCTPSEHNHLLDT